MEKLQQNINIYVNEYNIAVDKITKLSLKFAGGSYFMPISLCMGIFSLYVESDIFALHIIIAIIPIVLSFQIYNHIRYMILQFRISGYARHLEERINEICKDSILLWENSLARGSEQNTYEGLFLIIIYLCCFGMLYYNAYTSLNYIIYREPRMGYIAFWVTMIYYYLTALIICFLLFYINEHMATYKKASSINRLWRDVYSATSKSVPRSKGMINIKTGLIISVLLLSPTALLPLICLNSNNSDETSDYEYVIVLGNKSDNNVPSDDMKARMNYLIENINDYRNATIVFSGGNGEADLMRRYLEHNEEIKEKMSYMNIVTENQSLNTYENIINTYPMVRGRVAVITNDYHVYRTKMICAKLGLNYDFKAVKTSRYKFLKMLRECYAVYIFYLSSFLGK